tara:strand:+ start:1074 stop:1601 length:528 start_codon:yes stop_codon:yes gene_type:complete
MATDANTQTFSHHASLYSRNRRPFALEDNHQVGTKQTATTVTTIAVGDLNDALDDATMAHNGYATGNARYLHLQIENNDALETLELYAYNYAFGSWAKFYLPHGSPPNNVGDISEDDVVTQAAGTTNAAWVEAKWNTINGKFMVTIPIHGVDRIAFVHDGTVDANYIVRAACSTF